MVNFSDRFNNDINRDIEESIRELDNEQFINSSDVPVPNNNDSYGNTSMDENLSGDNPEGIDTENFYSEWEVSPIPKQTYDRIPRDFLIKINGLPLRKATYSENFALAIETPKAPDKTGNEFYTVNSPDSSAPFSSPSQSSIKRKAFENAKELSSNLSLHSRIQSYSVRNSLTDSSANVTILLSDLEYYAFMKYNILPLYIFSEIDIYLTTRYSFLDVESNSISHKYVSSFWGVISSRSVSGVTGSRGLNLSCLSMMRFLELTPIQRGVDTFSSIYINRFRQLDSSSDNAELKYDLNAMNISSFSTNMMNVFSIIVYVFYKGYKYWIMPTDLARLLDDKSFYNTVSEVITSRDTVMSYWQNRFKNSIGSRLLIMGMNDIKIVTEERIRSVQSRFIPMFNYKDMRDPYFEIDMNPLIMEYFLPGQRDLLNGTFSESERIYMLDYITSLLEPIGWEFYQEGNGDMVIKPPLYNAIPFDYTPHNLKEYDIKEISFSESEQNIVTQLEVTGDFYYGAISDEKPYSWYIDFSMASRYGIRPAKISRNYLSNSKSCRLYARTHMDLMNMSATTLNLIIVGTPEIRVGYPVYIEPLDIIGYVVSVEHSGSVGSNVDTNITLQGLRFRLRDTSGNIMYNAYYTILDEQEDVVPPGENFEIEDNYRFIAERVSDTTWEDTLEGKRDIEIKREDGVKYTLNLNEIDAKLSRINQDWVMVENFISIEVSPEERERRLQFWNSLVYFRNYHIFDSPDAPGSGFYFMNTNFVQKLENVAENLDGVINLKLRSPVVVTQPAWNSDKGEFKATLNFGYRTPQTGYLHDVYYDRSLRYGRGVEISLLPSDTGLTGDRAREHALEYICDACIDPSITGIVDGNRITRFYVVMNSNEEMISVYVDDLLEPNNIDNNFAERIPEYEPIRNLNENVQNLDRDVRDRFWGGRISENEDPDLRWLYQYYPGGNPFQFVKFVQTGINDRYGDPLNLNWGSYSEDDPPWRLSSSSSSDSPCSGGVLYANPEDIRVERRNYDWDEMQYFSPDEFNAIEYELQSNGRPYTIPDPSNPSSLILDYSKADIIENSGRAMNTYFVKIIDVLRGYLKLPMVIDGGLRHSSQYAALNFLYYDDNSEEKNNDHKVSQDSPHYYGIAADINFLWVTDGGGNRLTLDGEIYAIDDDGIQRKRSEILSCVYRIGNALGITRFGEMETGIHCDILGNGVSLDPWHKLAIEKYHPESTERIDVMISNGTSSNPKYPNRTSNTIFFYDGSSTRRLDDYVNNLSTPCYVCSEIDDRLRDEGVSIDEDFEDETFGSGIVDPDLLLNNSSTLPSYRLVYETESDETLETGDPLYATKYNIPLTDSFGFTVIGGFPYGRGLKMNKNAALVWNFNKEYTLFIGYNDQTGEPEYETLTVTQGESLQGISIDFEKLAENYDRYFASTLVNEDKEESEDLEGGERKFEDSITPAIGGTPSKPSTERQFFDLNELLNTPMNEDN